MMKGSKESVIQELEIHTARLELLRVPELARLHDVPSAMIGELSPIEARRLVADVITKRLRETDAGNQERKAD